MLQSRTIASCALLLLGTASGCINGAPDGAHGDGGTGGSDAEHGAPFDDAGGARPFGGTGGRPGFGGTTGSNVGGDGVRPPGTGALGGAGYAAGGASSRAAGGRSTALPPSSGGAGSATGGAGGATSVPDVCPDATTTSCSGGLWPNGTVYYTFASGFDDEQSVRDAMARWEAASANTVQFVEDASQVAKVTIGGCNGGGEVTGYSACVHGCAASICNDSDHQIGHIIGLGHEQARNDRDHYVRFHDQCDAGARLPRCGVADGVSDLGPFDYQSAMLSPVTDPLLTRWDRSPICPGNAGATCPFSVTGPGGSPTEADGAAVVELYTQSWKKFERTLATAAPSPYDPGALAPFSDDLAASVTIPPTSSPAVETWEGQSLAVYVRGSDDNVYKKSVTNGVWSAWKSLGAPSGAGPVSDPAIVSWAPGRSDLVVLRDGIVYIMSTPTWNTWQPLPAMPVPAASGPAIASWGPERLDVFIRGNDDQVYWESCTANCSGNAGTWSEWTAIYGGTIRGKPAAVARNGLIDVFVHSMGVDLWSVRYTDAATPQWGSYSLVDPAKILKWDPACPDCCSPSVGSHDGTTSDVYVRTSNDTIATGSFGSNGWSGYSYLGGVTAASPGVVAQVRTSKRTDLVILTPEENDHGDLHYGTWWKSRTY